MIKRFYSILFPTFPPFLSLKISFGWERDPLLTFFFFTPYFFIEDSFTPRGSAE